MKNNYLKSGPIFLAFLCMGFGDVVGPLTSLLQNEYTLSNFTASLVTFMGFIMFGLLSIPMGIYQDRRSKKLVLLLGLLAAFAGILLPILNDFSSFAFMLGSLLLLGTGATLLQVAGNPIMRDVSPEGKYSRNLSFGQFIKAIGSLSGSLIPLLAAKYWDLDWKVLFPIYASILVIVIIYLSLTKIKEKNDSKATTASFASVFKLLTVPYVFFMVLAIFLYVGAEVSMSAKLPNYLKNNFNFDIETLGLLGTLFFFLALTVGRFLGGIILNWLSPSKFLKITTFISLLGIIGLYIASTATMGFVAISIIGLGFANIFPLVFSITIDKMPDRSNEISGLMVTAIIGGAFVPLAFGLVADLVSLMAGFIVCIVCIGYIFLLSFYNKK